MIPIVNVLFAAKLSRKTFDYALSRYKKKRINQSPRGCLVVPPIVDDPIVDQEEIVKQEQRTTKEDEQSTAKEIIASARKVHIAVLSQFNSPARVSLYREILSPGIGFGKYATQEKFAYAAVESLFETHELDDFSDNDDEGDDNHEYDLEYNVKFTSVSKKISMAEKMILLKETPHTKEINLACFPIPSSRHRSHPNAAFISILFLL